jgi:hypothetical protein
VTRQTGLLIPWCLRRCFLLNKLLWLFCSFCTFVYGLEVLMQSVGFSCLNKVCACSQLSAPDFTTSTHTPDIKAHILPRPYLMNHVCHRYVVCFITNKLHTQMKAWKRNVCFWESLIKHNRRKPCQRESLPMCVCVSCPWPALCGQLISISHTLPGPQLGEAAWHM